MKNLIPLMKKFNFTEYETKVYVTLLKVGPSTGYEISKQSSVPRSRVYNILETLIQKGIVLEAQTNPILYSAIPINEFKENISRNVSSSLEEIDNYLVQYEKNTDSEALWNIDGFQNILNKSKYLIQYAKEEVLIQIWQEMVQLLQKTNQRLKKFVLILFSETQQYDLPFDHYYKHGFEKDKLKEMGSRWISVVIDEKEMIFGSISSKVNGEAVWTKNHSMVFLAREHIVHDAYCLNIIQHLDEKTKKEFGDDLEKIRKIY
jgi:sugar-specific transcriptional regulator TrmB